MRGSRQSHRPTTLVTSKPANSAIFLTSEGVSSTVFRVAPVERGRNVTVWAVDDKPAAVFQNPVALIEKADDLFWPEVLQILAGKDKLTGYRP